MAVRSLRYNTFEGRNWKGATFATDADALAFLEAAQLYDRNQQKAIVDLVRSLKSAGLWSKMKAIYPFIGGTASSHKWNLKDPRDVDAAFRLTFNGGWTHDANGILGNGTNTVADTNIQPQTHLTAYNTHLSLYSLTNNSTTFQDMSSYDGVSNTAVWNLGLRWGGGNIFFTEQYDNSARYVYSSSTDSRGWHIGSRTSSTDLRLYRNGTQSGSTTTSTSTNWTSITGNIRIGNRVSSANFTNRQYAFASVGDGLTSTEVTAMNSIIDLYQKRLGRAV